MRYRLAAAADVAVELFDVSGRRVRTLSRGLQSAGEHSITLARTDGDRPLSAGLYWVRLGTEDHATVARLVVLD